MSRTAYHSQSRRPVAHIKMDRQAAQRPRVASVSPSGRHAHDTSWIGGACACDGGCPRCQGVASRGSAASAHALEKEADVIASATVHGLDVPTASSQAPLQVSSVSSSFRHRDTLNSTVDSRLSRSAGRPLSPEQRSSFEAAWGHDLGEVRIHTDGEADRAARALGALAFTFGPHVVFRSGAYSSSDTGRRLLTHELVHTLQQAQGASGHGQAGLIQKADAGEGAPTDEWIVRMQALRDAAFAGTLTQAQEAQFVAGLNEVIAESDYSKTAGVVLPMEHLPASLEFRPGHVYFDKNPKQAAEGLNQPICKVDPSDTTGYIPQSHHQPGVGNSPAMCARGFYLGDIILLGPDSVGDTRTHTQAVFEHEAVHYFLSWYRLTVEHGPTPEVLSLDERIQIRHDQEALTYAEELVHIFEMSRAEMESSVHLRLRYYSAATEQARSDSDAWVAANLAKARASNPSADLATLRSIVEETMAWVELPNSLVNPANLSLVKESVQRMLALLQD